MGEHTPTKRLTVNRPTRDADRNRTLADQADPATEEMLFPSLDTGITLLDLNDGRGIPILQSLILDHLLLHDGPAFWVDTNGHATMTTLGRIAPSQRLLNRINVARGFTAYQHYGAVCDLPTAVNKAIQTSTDDSKPESRQPPNRDDETSPHTPALIVVPAVDAQYRTDDTLDQTDAKTLQARMLARLSSYADGYDIPVLVTRSERNEFTDPVVTAADHRLECEQTRMGPRIVGEDFETLVYPVGDGTYYQTTFAYWRQLLAARAAQVGVEPTTPESTPTPEGVGTSVAADGETIATTADPLLDAWTATGGGGQ